VDAMDPTNNAAEREIRPAVLIRKTNGCNRSQTGARTHSILTSVIRTCQKHGQDFVNAVKRVLRQSTPLTVDLVGEAGLNPAQGP
jgi:transposase